MFTLSAYSTFYRAGVLPEETAAYDYYYNKKPYWQSTDKTVKVFHIGGDS